MEWSPISLYIQNLLLNTSSTDNNADTITITLLTHPARFSGIPELRHYTAELGNFSNFRSVSTMHFATDWFCTELGADLTSNF